MARPDRVYPKVVVRKNVRNQSSRLGRVPTLIVLHSTEGRNIAGKADLQGLANWFDNPASQASSHVATDADGTSARFVWDKDKAWTCAGFNAISLNIEQVGFASQKEWTLMELRETARWVAYWSKKWGIPIRLASVDGPTVVRTGIVTHEALGAYGGGHHDPGPGCDIYRVMSLAKRYRRYM